ncbi:sodium-dependent nutrient amino acid transporter 1-like [Hermetia illucens]|nr:sodium-dependent nutrient amino acid transporter 1-like [Hermetia illucens]
MPNGWDGVLQLFQPDWKEFQSLEIWYHALVQVFFSLGICFGPTTMFASFNKFSYNMFTDILITTSVNALLTIAVGCTFFAAAGNLGQTSHANFEDHFQNVFIYYSEAIAKFDYVPQITSLLLFSLIFLLGIASISALMFFVVQMLRDEFLIKKASKLAVPLTLIAFLFSSVYTTPIGKNVANLLDLYGVPYAIGFNAVLELIAFDWIYGVKRICDDIEFMFGFRTRSIWRMAWYTIPVSIIILLAYQLVYDGIQSGVSSAQKVTMDFVGYATGWGFIVFIIFTIWLWGSYVVFKQPKGPFIKRVKAASRPEPNWGPAESSLLLNYRYFTLKKDNITT